MMYLVMAALQTAAQYFANYLYSKYRSNCGVPNLTYLTNLTQPILWAYGRRLFSEIIFFLCLIADALMPPTPI